MTPTFVYHYVFDGFAAVIPPDQLDAVRNDPRVQAVVPDRVVTAFVQTIPTGIQRIEADENPTAHIDGTDERVDVDVAVLDTAGKSTHPDLNQHAWGNCTPSHDNTDDNGHGTHVSGTIGALDNGTAWSAWLPAPASGTSGCWSMGLAWTPGSSAGWISWHSTPLRKPMASGTSRSPT